MVCIFQNYYIWNLNNLSAPIWKRTYIFRRNITVVLLKNNQLQTGQTVRRRNEIRRTRGALYKLRLNDGFADNNPGSLFRTTMKYETWVAEIFREVLLSINPGSNRRASRPLRFLRAMRRDASSLKGRNIHIHYRCAPQFSRPRACPMRARLSCLARASRPWKFIGKTRRDRSRSYQGDDLARLRRDTWVSQNRRSGRCSGVLPFRNRRN